jgi:hypothetical protein
MKQYLTRKEKKKKQKQKKRRKKKEKGKREMGDGRWEWESIHVLRREQKPGGQILQTAGWYHQ